MVVSCAHLTMHAVASQGLAAAAKEWATAMSDWGKRMDQLKQALQVRVCDV